MIRTVFIPRPVLKDGGYESKFSCQEDGEKVGRLGAEVGVSVGGEVRCQCGSGSVKVWVWLWVAPSVRVLGQYGCVCVCASGEVG